MSDFDPHITIEDKTASKDMMCSVKDIIIDTHRLKIETPMKVLSGKAISEKIAMECLPRDSTPIFEITKAYDRPNYYASLIETLEYGGSKSDWADTLSSSFKLQKKLEKKFRNNVTVSTVFQYYPLNDVEVRNQTVTYQRMKPDTYQTFLDFIYSASTSFILTPDVIFSSTRKGPISVEEYLKFIDFSVETFEYKNNKAIFVPLQIDLASDNLNRILKHYNEKGYTNIWINFKAKGCTGSSSGKLRTLSRLISENLGNDTVIYSSQLKRERDVTKSTVPALDLFPPFINADFVGVNRTLPAIGADMDLAAERKGFKSKEELSVAMDEVRHSLFNPNTYTYILPEKYPRNLANKETLSTITQNVSRTDFYNGILINKELSLIRTKILDEVPLLPYLNTKEGFRDNMNVFGNTSKQKSTPGENADISDFL